MKRKNPIIGVLLRDKTANAEQISIETNVSVRTVKRLISVLSEKGIIKRIGSRKTGYWEVNIVI